MELKAKFNFIPSWGHSHRVTLRLSGVSGAASWSHEGNSWTWALEPSDFDRLPEVLSPDWTSPAPEKVTAPEGLLDGCALELSVRTESQRWTSHIYTYEDVPEIFDLLQWIWAGLYDSAPEEYREPLVGLLIQMNGYSVLFSESGPRLFGRPSAAAARGLELLIEREDEPSDLLVDLRGVREFRESLTQLIRNHSLGPSVPIWHLSGQWLPDLTQDELSRDCIIVDGQ